jgi:hypothetical protein
MTSVLEQPAAQTGESPARRLRATTAAVRLSFCWLGTRKTLNSDQKAQAAATFGADDDCLSASKRLLNVKHPAFKAVTAVKNRIVSYWKGVSLPFPEPGVRLIRQDRVDAFNTQMEDFQDELREAVEQLDEHYDQLKHGARQRLGDLFDPGDYPESLRGLFAVTWDHVNTEPPPYLQQLNPEIYRQESQRVAARFDQAVELAEAAFIDELHKLVAHLTERLAGEAHGKPKIFRDSAIENLTEFFERFRRLNVRSNEQLDELVGQCRQIVGGVDPQTLRDNQVLRTSVATELGEVQNVLDDLLVDRPRRNIMRRHR